MQAGSLPSEPPGKSLYLLCISVIIRSRYGTSVVFLNFIYLFIYLWLHWVFVALQRLSLVGATVHCSARASHCSGFSCCGGQALGTLALVFVAHGLSSCDMWALECAGSVVVVHGLRCSLRCGVFPDQGSDSCPLHWQMDSLPLRD